MKKPQWTMSKYKTIRLLLSLGLLLAAWSASAQHLPERGQVRKGNRHFNKGHYEQSIEHYTKALASAPQNFEATYDLGNALYKSEQFDKAEQTLRTAAADSLRTEDERAEAFYNLGNAQFKQEEYKEALESYKQSLRLNPADQEAKYNYAYTKRLLDQQKNKDQDKDQPQDQQQDQQNQQQDQQQDQQNQQENPADPDKEQEQPAEAQAQPQGISPQEQERMLDAIQAQEDKTQDKLKEKQGVVVRGKKNW